MLVINKSTKKQGSGELGKRKERTRQRGVGEKERRKRKKGGRGKEGKEEKKRKKKQAENTSRNAGHEKGGPSREGPSPL